MADLVVGGIDRAFDDLRGADPRKAARL